MSRVACNISSHLFIELPSAAGSAVVFYPVKIFDIMRTNVVEIFVFKTARFWSRRIVQRWTAIVFAAGSGHIVPVSTIVIFILNEAKRF